MNKLESVTIEQYRRVKAAGAGAIAILGEAQGEIMAAATPQRFEEIMALTRRDFRRLSLRNTPEHALRLAQAGFVTRGQGYVGGILPGEEPNMKAVETGSVTWQLPNILPKMA